MTEICSGICGIKINRPPHVFAKTSTDSKTLIFVFLYLIFRMNDCVIAIQVCITSIK